MRDFNSREVAKEYIEKHNLSISVDELFKEFDKLCKVAAEFDEYLKKNNSMLRDARLLDKRKVFCKWFFDKNQSENTTNLLIMLSEMLFVSERTVQKDTFCVKNEKEK